VSILLKEALKKNAKKFVQISTDEVMGSIEKGSWTSDSPLLPNSPYAASKASAELLIKAYAKTYRLNYLITRSSNNYGPRQATEKLIPKLISNLIENQPLPIYGTGQNYREWIHVSDNVKLLLTLILQDKLGTWNIPGGVELSNLQLVDLIRTLMPESRSKIVFVEDRKGHDFRYAMSPVEFSKEIGMPQFIPILDGFRQTIDWYRNLSEV
jgi:dTDP-glucose 4,6-dehydratase